MIPEIVDPELTNITKWRAAQASAARGRFQRLHDSLMNPEIQATVAEKFSKPFLGLIIDECQDIYTLLAEGMVDEGLELAMRFETYRDCLTIENMVNGILKARGDMEGQKGGV
ncbi:Tyrosinase [Madurella mycetomatis]|uniref:Tyrosinase n=1 Tax=Madurella mycetomatis TaxID=100816 RepID=A0A175WDM7_9PEZI|nr:Tyrosinase [Madurella mycetomatis]